MARRNIVFLLILIIWLGFGLRLHELGSVPLRGDEAFSARFWADLPLSTSLAEIAPLDPHPPLAFVIVRFWRHWIGGIDSPAALRMLGVLANTVGIPAVFALALRLSGRSIVGLSAALIWAMHPYEIWHSQDFRNYPIWAGMSVSSLWLGLRLIDHPKPRNWLLYGLAAGVTAFIFYTELFTMLAFAAFTVVSKRTNHAFVRRVIALQAVITTFVLLAFLLLQSERIFSGAYPGNVQGFHAPDYLTRLIPTLVGGGTIPANLSAAWLVICIGLAGLAVIVGLGSRRQLLLVATVALLPLFLIGLASQRLSLFHPRYVLAAVPAIVLLISLGSDYLSRHMNRQFGWHQNATMFGLLLPWLALSIISLNAHFTDPAFRKSPAWDELGEFLNERVNDDDLVIHLSADVAFGYYYKGAGREKALPENPWQPRDAIVAELKDALKSYASIWVVSNAIRTWQNADVVETWMQAHWQPVLLSNASGLGLRQFRDWELADEYASSLARFDETVELVDYRFFADPLPTGEILLWLYWRPLTQSPRELKSFVHIYGDINPSSGSILWSQNDQLPQNGRLDARSWEILEVFRAVYYLPADTLTDGEYQLSIGWYDPDSDERLLTEENEDHFVLESFAFP